ncbi:hypothetical protein BC941DRAFT_404680 [Chlamydoabsidia padenii]|nr:hypothetical protein BC941DRAFT_404680 [Chlamydoabsidia padenii]
MFIPSSSSSFATLPPTSNTVSFPTETHYNKDNTGNYTTYETSGMTFLPELAFSSLLQTQCNLPQSPIMIQPIHHTLENATITYDTLGEQQKQLVKDVFFSPAMSAHPSSVSSCTTSLATMSLSTVFDDDDNTTTFSQTDKEDDPWLHNDDSTLFFGALDFDLEQVSTTPSFVLKRKRETVIKKHHHPWSNVTSPKSTPPMSPNEHYWDHFDSSGEDDSSSDNDSSRIDYQTMKTGFKHISVQDNDNASDNDLLSSWEPQCMVDTKHNTKKSSKVAKKITHSITKKRKQHKKVKLTCTLTESHDHLQKVDPRPTCHPTLYQKLTRSNVDWCRYCGTTEGVNWRPGPWGKRTLCNKHGCDYKGYGFACKLPRLDLTGYVHESIHHRDRPVLQFYCATCHRMESWATNVLVRCEGCYKSYHQKCYHGQNQVLSDAFVAGDQPWYCDEQCRDNVDRRRVVVEISRKRLPLMCAPNKNQDGHIQSSLTHRVTRAGNNDSDSK